MDNLDDTVFNTFAEQFQNLSRLEQERIKSSLYNQDTDYIQGYKYAADNICKWLQKALTNTVMVKSSLENAQISGIILKSDFINQLKQVL